MSLIDDDLSLGLGADVSCELKFLYFLGESGCGGDKGSKINFKCSN